jgi:hypothetical protein
VFSFAVTPGLRFGQPAYRTSILHLLCHFLSLPTPVSLAGEVDGGGTEGAAGDASGEGDREGSGVRPGARRPGVAGSPEVLSTKV